MRSPNAFVDVDNIGYGAITSYYEVNNYGLFYSLCWISFCQNGRKPQNMSQKDIRIKKTLLKVLNM